MDTRHTHSHVEPIATLPPLNPPLHVIANKTFDPANKTPGFPSSKKIYSHKVTVWEQIATMSMPALPPKNDEFIIPDAAPTQETMSIRMIKKKRVTTGTKHFFLHTLYLVLGLLLISTIILFYLVAPYPIFKVVAFIVLVIVVSHILSLQVRRINQARRQMYQSATQLMRAIKKEALPQGDDNDMKHLQLIKQDTTVYLRALRTKALKKDS